MLHRKLILAVAATIAVGVAVGAQQPAAAPAAAPKTGGVAVVQVYKGQAVVLWVDYQQRNVTVTINGALHNYTVSDSVRGVRNIKKGDTLNIQVVEALGVYLKKDNAPPVGTAADMMTVQPVGKPAMQGIKTHDMSGIITKLDHSNRIMSILVPPKGDTMTFVADTSLHDLHAMKIGDHVLLRYTQAMVVAVDP